ncbi:MAG: NAD(P)/FAD-dependent oxidoreductase [Clostridiales bacterium]|nr:NAD(P)/FAD-dependent oxidoreductase [Clostridiales bacterium]
MTYNIAVIGGGAAGMAAAIKASMSGAGVTLYEREGKLGRKLGITGKGRCNVTNDCTPEEFMASVVRNPKFLYSAAFRYPPSSIKEFFEKLSVPLKTERGGRVFPVSDKASDIVNALRREMKRLGVEVKTDFRVREIAASDDGTFSVSDGRATARHTAVIICTGGVSYPLTGSTGDGYGFAERFGITVSDRYPSLVPIETAEDTEELAGLTLKNVRLSAMLGNKTVFSEFGEMLFTHFGVSGPLVLSASAVMGGRDASEYRLEIDLKAAVSEEDLDERLSELFREGAAKDFVNATAHLLPVKLVKRVAAIAKIPERIKTGDVTREMRREYIKALKHFPLTPVCYRPIDEAIVTRGGINIKEIDPRTMEAKRVGGLYFAGEVIDVDAYTGGYNLQIAFSSGFLAGEAAAERFFEMKDILR